MTAYEEDRGLHAVRRVRSAREQDSRIGLQHAIADSNLRAGEAARARTALVEAVPFIAGSTQEFRSHAGRGLALAEDISRADLAAGASRRVADEASRRWQVDRTRVRTVDVLLERRAVARAEKRRRHEVAEQDDLAATAWLRRQGSVDNAEEHR